MIRSISLKALRPELPKVIDMIDTRFDRYFVVKHGKPVAVMMSVDDYESMIETLDILADKTLMKRLRKSEQEIKQGKTRSWEEVKRSLEKL